MRKAFAILLAVCAVISCTNHTKESKAAQLYSPAKKMENGKKLMISLHSYYGREKPKWSTSNKKIKIIKRYKKSCKIQAVKTGTSYVKCKVGNKKYKIKITIKPECLATYNNYKKLKKGMSYDYVIKILGKHTRIENRWSQTQEEYEDIAKWNKLAGGGWTDQLYRKRVEYVWKNPWNSHYIYATFNDNILVKKSYY